MLHLAVPSLGSLIKIATSVWGKLKDLVQKKVSSSPWKLWFVYRHTSPKRGTTEVGFGCQHDALQPQVEMPACNGPLKELPPALGCERLTVPAITTSPELVIPPALPAQVFAPTVTKAPQQSVDRMTPSRKRRMRRRVTRRKQRLRVAKKRTSR